MTRSRLDRALFLDLELTCWETQDGDKAPPPGQRQEIIQLGVVEIDTEALQITRRGNWLVRPRTSTVSPFCTQLTGITPEAVKRTGRPLPEVLATFIKTFGPGAKVTYAWGRDDQDIAAACAEYGITSPLGDFVNLAQQWRLNTGADRKLAIEEVMVQLGLAWPGRQHDALVDAEATAMIWMSQAAMMRQALAPAAAVAGKPRADFLGCMAGEFTIAPDFDAESVAERLKAFRSAQAEDAMNQLSEVLAAVEAHGTADEQDWVLREMTRVANHARFEISKRLMAEAMQSEVPTP